MTRYRYTMPRDPYFVPYVGRQAPICPWGYGTHSWQDMDTYELCVKCKIQRVKA